VISGHADPTLVGGGLRTLTRLYG